MIYFMENDDAFKAYHYLRVGILTYNYYSAYEWVDPDDIAPLDFFNEVLQKQNI